MNLAEDLKKLVSEILEIPMDILKENESFTDDYNVDSLRALEILAAIENKYDVTFEPERLQDMTNLGNVIKITGEYLEAKANV